MNTTHSIPAAKPLKVLVADDNPVNRRLMISILGVMGHTGMVVRDGVDALKCLSKHPFDLVLMDVMMPNMNGLEALEAIRSQEQVQGGHLPVIMVTAHSDGIDQFKYRQAGADGFVSKPVHLDTLHSELNRLFDRPRPIMDRRVNV